MRVNNVRIIHTANSAIRGTAGKLLLLFVAVVAVIGLVIAIAAQVYAQGEDDVPAGSRLITLYERGVERSFVTTASTIRAALAEADIEIDARDRVEPSLDDELVADQYTVNIYRARPLLVVDGMRRVVVMTAARSAEQIAQDADITLYPEDITTFERTNSLVVDAAAEKFVVARATPFTFTLYGDTYTARTQAETVKEMLAEKDITLEANDRVSTSLDTKITADMNLRVWREGKQTITRDEPVDFEVEQVQDVNREVGYRSVRTPGVKGERTVTYEVTIQDGKEVERKEIASTTKKAPQKQVEVVGAKPPFGGDLAAAFAALRQCESGGNYSNKNNPLYRGAYQFSYQTWAGNGGYHDPADAPPALQDAAALALYERRGWQPWPACSKKLGLR